MMDKDYRYTFAAWAEAFTIFAKYKSDYGDISAEHDVIYAGPSPDIVRIEDLARLDDLGWHVDSHLDSFYHHV